MHVSINIVYIHVFTGEWENGELLSRYLKWKCTSTYKDAGLLMYETIDNMIIQTFSLTQVPSLGHFVFILVIHVHGAILIYLFSN